MTGINTTLDTLDWLELDIENFDPETRSAFEKAVAEGRCWEFLEEVKRQRDAAKSQAP